MRLRFLSAAVACLAAAACGPDARTVTPSVHLVHADGARSWVAVSGLPYGDLTALAEPREESAWQAILSVRVAPGQPPVAGTYAAANGTLRFLPRFPFDRGRTYIVRFDASKLPRSAGDAAPWRTTVIEDELTMPGAGDTPGTVVRRIVPTAEVWPQNQLRVYIEFSAPMSGRGGIEHLHLLDEQGHEVAEPFLPLDYDFWNADRTRFTAFLDPGRVKSGLVPRLELGPSLEAGRRYTLVVDREWRDGFGQPLAQEFRREFRTGPADTIPIDLARWRLALPKAGTTDALTVDFGEPLDRALLLRALAVRAPGGQIVVGDARAGDGDHGWSFEPEQPWLSGRYELMALSILEDLAGNQIGRAFEVDTFTKAENPDPTTAVRAFEIR